MKVATEVRSKGGTIRSEEIGKWKNGRSKNQFAAYDAPTGGEGLRIGLTADFYVPVEEYWRR